MRPGVFFPYRTASDGVELEVVDVRGGSLSGGSVDGYSQDSPSVEVEVRLDVDLDAIARTVTPTGDPDDLVVGVRLQAAEARWREFRAIDTAGELSATLRLSRSDWVGTVTLTGLVLRGSVVEDAEAVFASDRGAVVAWSNDVNVHMDDREPSITGDHLDVRWISFKGDPRLAGSAADLFAVLEEGELPVVFLNKDIENAFHVLHSQGTHGARARIRDATFHLITHQVWSSLIGDALLQFQKERRHFHETAPEEILEEIGGWRSLVLSDWARYLVEDSNDPVGDLLESSEGALIKALPSAIQRRFSTINGFRGLVRDIDSLGSS